MNDSQVNNEVTDTTEVTRKIRLLLDKAQSTTFPEEAKLLTAKALTLMEKHSIEEAMLREGRIVEVREVVSRKVSIHAPYSQAKAMLAVKVFGYFDCQAVQLSSSTPAMRVLHVFGMSSDIDKAEMLLASLSIQQMGELIVAEDTRPEYVSKKTFTNNFLLGYAAEVHRRLTAIKAKAARSRQEASNEGTGGMGTELVLLSKVPAVREAVKERYPRLGTVGSSGGYDGSGQAAGSAAGGRAQFDNGARLGTSSGRVGISIGTR